MTLTFLRISLEYFARHFRRLRLLSGVASILISFLHFTLYTHIFRCGNTIAVSGFLFALLWKLGHVGDADDYTGVSCAIPPSPSKHVCTALCGFDFHCESENANGCCTSVWLCFIFFFFIFFFFIFSFFFFFFSLPGSIRWFYHQ